MRAVRFHSHGGPEVLVEEDVPAPHAGPAQVLVRVRAVALNRLDLWVRTGIPSLRLGLPHILGSDVSGVVEMVGEGVTSVRPEDAVVINPGLSCGRCRECLRGRDNLCREYHILGEHVPGGYAEFVAVPEPNVIPKPSRLTFEEAAAFPLVFLTAWNMLVTHARVAPGDVVLIWGAGSGVGSAGIQIARLHGSRVIAVAGTDEKLGRARDLGADEVINHRTAKVQKQVKTLTGNRGVDVVFEHVGAATWDASIRMLARGGRLVTCGATSGPEVTMDARYVFGRALSIFGTWMGSKGELLELLPFMEDGRLRPVVDSVLPLSQAREAHRRLEAGDHFGKIVLVP